MGKLTKSQLMDKLAEVNDMSKKEVVAFMENFVSLAYEEVKGNGEFIIPGIGKMVKAHRKARMGRNPAT
ncbi:HU family DNA-binding protein, partial [bacterium]|nr:HU family DNA-binding protein [bacterium]